MCIYIYREREDIERERERDRRMHDIGLPPVDARHLIVPGLVFSVEGSVEGSGFMVWDLELRVSGRVDFLVQGLGLRV